ncbi:hypothetical protein KC365_g4938 [Hortaea werneckii]|nr:hypothetical protein KC342_g8254 [Hortaea werneckii]KAI7096712.1 hypothetical protein KC339_g10193 [Hortaea werneckii]KAI7237038.1 hypothetical protein KC365_g4938 [Hortaea werneckii]
MSKRRAEASSSPSTSPEPEGKKRKFNRDEIPDDEKLEVDVSLPEPPSKKALRAEKKRQKEEKKAAKADRKATKAADKGSQQESQATKTHEYKPEEIAEHEAAMEPTKPAAPANKKGDHGIWIGNLPWSATRDSLRQFFKDQGQIWDREITRIHMPAPHAKPNDGPIKAHNKGFAYVDFSTPAIQQKALGLSEKLLVGRRVLIKNAKSFEGRPDKPKTGAEMVEKVASGNGVKEATNRIFVGNLGFDVTKDDLAEHFSQAGLVEDIHMATFEDSGKCKGFAWVRFQDVEAAQAAVRGFVYRRLNEDGEEVDDETAAAQADESEEEEESGNKKKKGKGIKKHKKHINRLHGREMRCEFAEDSQTRYKKRFGKADNSQPGHDRRDKRAHHQTGHDGVEDFAAAAGTDGTEDSKPQGKPQRRSGDADQRREERRKRHEKIDARTIAPGKALASAPRSSGAIVAGAGKKMTFD